MKIKSLCLTLALTGAALPLSAPAHAQNAVTSGTGGRLSVVELRDTNLSDALEMIFQAAGNPSHIIDEQAQTVPIPATTLNNIAWDAAVRNLTQVNGYKVSRNSSGTYLIEPRVIAPVDGGFFPGGEGAPFGGPGAPFQSGSPMNPFQRGRSRGNPQMRTDANPQTRPSFGGRAIGTNPLDPNEGKDYKIIIVRHIYAGGIAQLFANSSVIDTQGFVSPGQLGGGGRGGIGGGGGGFGGGGGGLGGGGLGGGGGIGGIGGGGFGGGGGGFGGGIGGGGGGFGGGLGF